MTLKPSAVPVGRKSRRGRSSPQIDTQYRGTVTGWQDVTLACLPRIDAYQGILRDIRNALIQSQRPE